MDFGLTTPVKFEVMASGINGVALKLGYVSISGDYPLSKAVETYDYITDIYHQLLKYAENQQEQHPDKISDDLIERMSDAVTEVLDKLNKMESTHKAVKTLDGIFVEFLEICSKF